jgi:hypothetical protein
VNLKKAGQILPEHPRPWSIEITVPRAGIGLPIGSLTSQILANLYTGATLDRYLQQQLGERLWYRYMDDLVVLGRSSTHRRIARPPLDRVLARLRADHTCAAYAAMRPAAGGFGMTGAVRIQRKRTKGWKMPPNTVSVARPGRFGNPWRVGMWRGYTAEDAVRDYRLWLDRDPSVRSADGVFGKPPTREEIITALRGRNLACWCPLDQPCHADVLLELANGEGATP